MEIQRETKRFIPRKRDLERLTWRYRQGDGAIEK